MPSGGDGIYYFSTYVLVEPGEDARLEMRLMMTSFAQLALITAIMVSMILLQDHAAPLSM